MVFGRPLSSHEEANERLSVATGLAVFASDNISSSAYASEEIMRVLVLAGAGALALTMPITVAIVVVLAIVVISYRQTISRLSQRRWLVHRRQRQPGHAARPDRRGRAADRLRPDGRGVGRGRRGGAHLDRSRSCSTPRVAIGVAIVVAIAADQPARHSRERPRSSASRPTSISSRSSPCWRSACTAFATNTMPDLHGRRRRGRRRRRRRSASCSSCARSPRARWR